MLVIVVLTLLGVSFLLVADTENRIAENERLSSQALYVAESATRAVLQWFDRPGSPANLLNPPLAAVDRSLRQIDGDGDGPAPPILPGDSAWVTYKQGIDLNADGQDDLFDKPYRIDPRNTLLGRELGPDLRIDGEHPGPGFDFLNQLSRALLADYLSADVGIRARVSRIDIYAPPYLQIGSEWVRYGIATVKVTGRIYRVGFGPDQILAERMVKAVLSEIPYANAYGPLHACRNLTLQGQLAVHWGAVTGAGDVRVGSAAQIPASLARAPLQSARIDPLWPNDLPGYRSSIAGQIVEDPWLRVLGGGDLVLNGSHYANSQIWPHVSGQLPNHGAAQVDQSNLFQQAVVTCPDFDYELWKSIARSGRERVEYYVWNPGDPADRFSRDGVGTPRTFQDITDHPALFFFDTSDAQPPRDDDGDGVFDNLTPAFTVSGNWSARGLVYLNAQSFQGTATSPASSMIRAPGEPFLDSNRNGRYDTGEEPIYLQYPTSLGGVFRADSSGTVRDAAGPAVSAPISMDGIFYTSGRLDLGAAPGVAHHGSFIAAGEVVQSNATPADLYWDESIGLGDWPPPDWELPRVTVSRWETDM